MKTNVNEFFMKSFASRLVVDDGETLKGMFAYDT